MACFRENLLAVLEAYFDESDRKSGDFCVAGCVYTRKNARRLVKRWKEVTGGKVFRASKAAQGRGAFDGLSKEESDYRWDQLASAIVETRRLIVSIHCNLSELSELVPHDIKLRKLAYTVCSVGCISEISKWLSGRGKATRVSYTLDAGHIGEDATAAIIADLVAYNESTRKKFRFHNLAFANSSDSPLLQAADFVAWEIGRGLETIPQGTGYRNAAVTLLAGRNAKYSIVKELSGDTAVAAVEAYERAWGLVFGRSA